MEHLLEIAKLLKKLTSEELKSIESVCFDIRMNIDYKNKTNLEKLIAGIEDEGGQE